MSASDRLRRMAWPAPIVVFFYVLVIKGCLLDGWPGWFYALQRGVAECMIALELIDRRLFRDPDAREEVLVNSLCQRLPPGCIP